MPTATLQKIAKDTDKHSSDNSVSKTITHNNARLFYDTDGAVYEFVGVDVSANRIYRNQDR
jgi:hypothetical protein